MNELYPNSILSSLSEEIAAAALDKSKVPLKALELIPKDQLILIMLDILDQFCKQNSVEKGTPFLTQQYAYKKYPLKAQAAKFCQSIEYSIENHSKGSREPCFLLYLLCLENNKEVVKFYLKSRKILMQFFFDDGSYRYHDAETTQLELEQWVNVATRIFSDIPSTRSVERLNSIVVKHAVQASSYKVKKTIDAVSFLEYCVVEFLRLKGFTSENLKSSGTDRSVSPINRATSSKKNESPSITEKTLSKNPPSSITGKDINTSQNINLSPPKGSMPKPFSTKAEASPISYKNANNDEIVRQVGDVQEHEVYDKTEINKTMGEAGLDGSPPKIDKSLPELRKEKRFLVKELTEQTNERKRIEDNLEKVLGEFSDLSGKHDELVDFTAELHKNFLYLMDYLKAKTLL